MATKPLTLTPAGASPLRVQSARVYSPWRGVWLVDCVLDLTPAQSAPSSGQVSAVVGGVTMTGTVDPRSSGSFGPSAHVRIAAGAGGWDKILPPSTGQDFHADNGVSSTQVYQSTASLVGETVQDLAPTTFLVDFVRSVAGPAMRVFKDALWWVDVTGVTNVGPRPSPAADASLVVLDFDPTRAVITFTCDTLLIPGSVITDPRFPAPVTVYDVEQVFDAQGSKGWALTGPSACSELVDDFKAAVLEWTRAATLRTYRYRLIRYQDQGFAGGPPRMALQAVTPEAGMPDLVPLAPWSGVAGVVSELGPSQEVLVVFENADPGLPRVFAYSLLGLPLKTKIDAQLELDLGPSAAAVKLAGGGNAIALASLIDDFISACVQGAQSASPGPAAAAALAAAVVTFATTFQWVVGVSTTGSPKVTAPPAPTSP